MRSHRIDELNDPHYRPQTPDEEADHSAKQAWFYAVLLDTVLLPTAKSIVRSVEHTYDAQLALHLIRRHMATSAEGLLYQRDLRTKITTTRIDARSVQLSFVLDLHDSVDTYNRLQQNPSLLIDDAARKEHMIAAVAPAPNLAEVHTREIENTILTGGHGYSYDDYFLIVRTTASLHDSQNSAPRRRINEIQIQEPATDAAPNPSFDVFAATAHRTDPPTRVPDDVWSTMTPDERRTWSSLSGTLRTALLSGVSPSPTRAVNRVTFADTPDDSSPAPDDAVADDTEAADSATAADTVAQVNQTASAPSGSDTGASRAPRAGAPGAIANAHAGDPRRLMSSRNGRPARRSANVVQRTPHNASNDSRWQSAIDEYWSSRDVYYDAAEDPSDF